MRYVVNTAWPNHRRAEARKNRAQYKLQRLKAHEAQYKLQRELQYEFDLADNDNRECYANISERLARSMWFYWYASAYPSRKYRSNLPPPWHGERPLIKEVELYQEEYLISPY